jgi:hypothetical protein
MSFYATHYQSGEEIRPGDRVLWSGTPGRVFFVLGLPGVPVEWTSPGLFETSEGFMLELDNGALVFENESDEDLDFLGRKE